MARFLKSNFKVDYNIYCLGLHKIPVWDFENPPMTFLLFSLWQVFYQLM